MLPVITTYARWIERGQCKSQLLTTEYHPNSDRSEVIRDLCIIWIFKSSYLKLQVGRVGSTSIDELIGEEEEHALLVALFGEFLKEALSNELTSSRCQPPFTFFTSSFARCGLNSDEITLHFKGLVEILTALVTVPLRLNCVQETSVSNLKRVNNNTSLLDVQRDLSSIIAIRGNNLFLIFESFNNKESLWNQAIQTEKWVTVVQRRIYVNAFPMVLDYQRMRRIPRMMKSHRISKWLGRWHAHQSRVLKAKLYRPSL